MNENTSTFVFDARRTNARRGILEFWADKTNLTISTDKVVYVRECVLTKTTIEDGEEIIREYEVLLKISLVNGENIHLIPDCPSVAKKKVVGDLRVEIVSCLGYVERSD